MREDTNVEHAFDAEFEKIFEAIVANVEEGGGGPFGAAVVLGGKLIGLGTNQVLAKGDVSRHAEVEALAQATRAVGSVSLRGATLLTSHFPCMMCYHAIKWAGINDVRFVFDTERTHRIFEFQGDASFLDNLKISQGALAADPVLRASPYVSPLIDALYFDKLVKVWRSKDRSCLTSYDVSKAG